MGATQFKRAELEDQEIISHYFEHHTSTVSGKMGDHQECTGIQK